MLALVWRSVMPSMMHAVRVFLFCRSWHVSPLFSYFVLLGHKIAIEDQGILFLPKAGGREKVLVSAAAEGCEEHQFHGSFLASSDLPIIFRVPRL